MRRQTTRTLPSNRLRHGLTSRAAAEARRPEADVLVRQLMAGAPNTPEVQETAEALAESMLALRAARRVRFELLSRQLDVKLADLEELMDQFEGIHFGNQPVVAARKAFLKFDEDQDIAGAKRILSMPFRDARELARIEEYERKIHSRYRKLVTRLDHVIIEARRRGGKG